MTTQNEPTTENAMVLTPRGQQLQSVRDGMEPGARPAAIIPKNFLEAQAMCAALAGAGLVPRAFAGNPANMLLVVMTGLEVGLPPMASLRLYTTWDGVPRLMAEGVRAIILRAPEIEHFEMATCSDVEATWIGKRRGRPEKSVTWTIERARRAGLTEKDIWKKYPQDMLNARASMQLGRIIAPDIVAGMGSDEEAKDGDFVDAQSVERKETRAFVAPPVTITSRDGSPAVLVASGGSGGSGQARVVMMATGPHVTPDDVRKMYGAPDGEKIARGMEEMAKDAKPQVVTVVEPPKKGAAAKAPKGPTPPTASAPSQKSSESTSTPAAGSISAEAPAASPPKNPAPPATGSTKDRWGQEIGDPTSAASITAPSPSAESAETSTSPTPPGAASVEAPVDAGFGDDDDALPSEDLVDFHAWVNSCKTQRDLAAGLPQWRTWSKAKLAAGDLEFTAKIGKKSNEMQDAYAKRKGEVPA